MVCARALIARCGYTFGFSTLDVYSCCCVTPRRSADVLSKSLRYLVAESDGQIMGFAYANWFRPRPAYRFSVENSVYVHPEARRGGIARLLMIELVARCEMPGARQMVAVIGDSANAGSLGLRPFGVLNRWTGNSIGGLTPC